MPAAPKTNKKRRDDGRSGEKEEREERRRGEVKERTTTTTTTINVDNRAMFAPPVHWPSDVVFLTAHSQPSDKLSAYHQMEFCLAPSIVDARHPLQVRACGYTSVVPITRSTAFVPAFGSELTSHPAVGQFGLFARKDIPPRTLVVPYLGHVHLSGTSENDEDATSQYDALVESHDGTRLGVDATHMGSEARFVNDYRGILVRPNLFFQQWSSPCPRSVFSVYAKRFTRPSNDDDDDDDDNGDENNVVDGVQTTHAAAVADAALLPAHVSGLALYTGAHAVKAGTELCVSYGKGWWAARRGKESESDERVLLPAK